MWEYEVEEASSFDGHSHLGQIEITHLNFFDK